MMFLGLDTSNYRTSVALYNSVDGIYQNKNQLLRTPEGKIGLRQSEALFQHVNQLPEMLERLPAGIGKDLTAIGVSTRPRAVEGSYMPCFLAGHSMAAGLAHMLGVPLYSFSHQQGHIAAALFSAGRLDLLEQEFLAWHLSGGTTELVRVMPDQQEIFQTEILGGTNDLAAGQIIDRAGKMLGLSFPAGPELEALAQTWEEKVKGFSPKLQGLEFSLSGVENKLQDLQKQEAAPAYITKFTLETIWCAIQKATAQALEEYPLPVLCTGGVMANRTLQSRMVKEFSAVIAKAGLSGDNAVGTAVLASIAYQRNI